MPKQRRNPSFEPETYDMPDVRNVFFSKRVDAITPEDLGMRTLSVLYGGKWYRIVNVEKDVDESYLITPDGRRLLVPTNLEMTWTANIANGPPEGSMEGANELSFDAPVRPAGGIGKSSGLKRVPGGFMFGMRLATRAKLLELAQKIKDSGFIAGEYGWIMDTMEEEVMAKLGLTAIEARAIKNFIARQPSGMGELDSFLGIKTQGSFVHFKVAGPHTQRDQEIIKRDIELEQAAIDEYEGQLPDASDNLRAVLKHLIEEEEEHREELEKLTVLPKAEGMSYVNLKRVAELPTYEFGDPNAQYAATYLIEATAKHPGSGSNVFNLKIHVPISQEKPGDIGKAMWAVAGDFLSDYEKKYPKADLNFRIVDGPSPVQGEPMEPAPTGAYLPKKGSFVNFKKLADIHDIRDYYRKVRNIKTIQYIIDNADKIKQLLQEGQDGKRHRYKVIEELEKMYPGISRFIRYEYNDDTPVRTFEDSLKYRHLPYLKDLQEEISSAVKPEVPSYEFGGNIPGDQDKLIDYATLLSDEDFARVVKLYTHPTGSKKADDILTGAIDTLPPEKQDRLLMALSPKHASNRVLIPKRRISMSYVNLKRVAGFTDLPPGIAPGPSSNSKSSGEIEVIIQDQKRVKVIARVSNHALKGCGL